MADYSRRRFLTRVAPALACLALLPACGQPGVGVSATVASRQPGPAGGTPAPVTPGAATPVLATPWVAATPTFPPVPTPTQGPPLLSFAQGKACLGLSGTGYPGSMGSPYRRSIHADGIKLGSFKDRVRDTTGNIAMCVIREILPSRWATPGGSRPADPHTYTAPYSLGIFTPIRVEIEQMAKGDYALPDLYIAIPGGRIDAECASYSGIAGWHEIKAGDRALYFFDLSRYTAPPPVPGDTRYRYYDADPDYPVGRDGKIRIAPGYDGTGTPIDEPVRLLTPEEVLREIVALLAAPAATPTR